MFFSGGKGQHTFSTGKKPGVAALVGETLRTRRGSLDDRGQFREVCIVLDLSDVEIRGLVAIDGDQVFAVVSNLCHHHFPELNWNKSK